MDKNKVIEVAESYVNGNIESVKAEIGSSKVRFAAVLEVLLKENYSNDFLLRFIERIGKS